MRTLVQSEVPPRPDSIGELPRESPDLMNSCLQWSSLLRVVVRGVMSVQDRSLGETSAVRPAAHEKTLLLNSGCLTAAIVVHIAKGLGPPYSVLQEET